MGATGTLAEMANGLTIPLASPASAPRRTNGVTLDKSTLTPIAIPTGSSGAITLDKSTLSPITGLGGASQTTGFGQRFLESSGLSGLVEAAKNPPQDMGDLFSMAMGPAKQLAGVVAAPAQHLSDIIAAHKAGDKEGVLSSASKFLDSFIPGTGVANQVAQNTIKDVQEGNAGAIAGTATGLAAQLALLKGLSKVGMVKTDLANFAYTAQGDLTPLAKSILHPTELPETLFRKLVPEPPVYPGAQLPSLQDFYEAKAADLTKRGAQQAILDRKAALEGKAVPLSKSPYAKFPPGTPENPLPEARAATAGKGTIVSPGSEPPDVKVTYQSVPGESLFEKVMTGDMNAVREWQRRGLPLPENVKFMVEDTGVRPWRNYRR
jgi:hypothetical protein